MVRKLKHDPLNIVICGVGGQGNILASELLGSALVENGYIVTMGETYGASQRGGSVMSHIRITEHLELGVLIPDHEAHIIVGFEPLETLRVMRQFGNPDTVVIFDNRPVYPIAVLGGEKTYPPIDDIVAELIKHCKRALIVPAAEIALSAGTGKVANIVLMGALTALDELPLSKEDFSLTIKQRFRGDVLKVNLSAFEKGSDALISQLQKGGN